MKNEHDLEEVRRQEAADLAPDDARPGNDAAVDRHRFIRHAVRKADAPRPPRDFAAHMERLVQDFAEDAAFEKWLVRATATVGLAVLAAFGIPAVGDLAQSHVLANHDIPWQLLLAGIAGGVAAWGIERLHLRSE